MKATRFWASVGVLVAFLLVPGGGARGADLGTAFTYQGQLKQGGVPVNDTADFEFSLWDSPMLGTQVGMTQTVNDKDVVNGFFTVQLDFGSLAFDGQARWMEIAVRSPAGSGMFTTLSPRQELTGHALRPLDAAVESGRRSRHPRRVRSHRLRLEHAHP